MSYPILAPKHTWYTQGGTTTLHSTFTRITFLDSYTPTGSEQESWNADDSNSGTIKCYVKGTELIVAGNGSGKIAMNSDSSNMFFSGKSDMFSNVTDIVGLDILDASSVTSMQSAFMQMSKIRTLDLVGWDTSNLNNMSVMFGLCTSLTSLNINGLNTAKVTNMTRLFMGCSSLLSLELSNLDVTKVTDMSRLFMNCSSLASININDWNASSVTNISSMFKNCTSLATLNANNFKFPNITSLSSMFSGCSALQNLNANNWDTSNITDMSNMFSNCSSLTNPPVGSWDVSNVTNMSGMFLGCLSLDSNLDIGSWDTSKVTDMSSMFSMLDPHEYINNPDEGTAVNLTSLPIENWDVSSCENMGWMFYNLRYLKNLNLSKWNTSKVRIFHHTFAHDINLVIEGIENWDTSSVETFNCIFNKVKNTSFDISKWDTSKCKSMSQMFEYCFNLKEIIGLENINTSNVTSFAQMFNGCQSITKLNLSNFDTSKANATEKDPYNNDFCGMNMMFSDMSSLKEITLGENFSFIGDGSCTACPAILPTPTMTGSSGKWHSADCATYAPADVPNNVKMTYYAIPDEVPTLISVKYRTMFNIAEATRKNIKVDSTLSPNEIAEAIDALAVGNISNDDFINLISNRINISNIIVPVGVKKIDNYSFINCQNLASIVLPSTLTTINTYAFSGCSKLAITEMPTNLKTIGTYAFRYCNSLQEITFTGVASTIATNAFGNCTNLIKINVPWSEGEVVNAPWGAVNATINYNYTEEEAI